MSQDRITKKAAIILGSPRRSGSTQALAQEAERGLTSRGIAVETVWLNGMEIRDCQGCHGCKKGNNHDCVIMDDMQDVYHLMRESSGLIVASPVYFANVSALTRLWLDRLVPFLGPEMQPGLDGAKPVSFIFTQNLPDTLLFEPGLRSFMDAVAMTGLERRDYLIAGDCEAGIKSPVTGRQDLMDRAYRLGRDLLD